MTAVRLLPIGAARAGAQLWRARGKSFATVAVKATFEASRTALLELREAGDDIVARDEHWDQNPTKSLKDASDLVPYLARGEVLLRGSAHVAAGARSVLRLTVARGIAVMLDKRLVARGDGASGATVTVPLTFESALGGPGRRENPVGRATPLVVDPADVNAPGCFGPISRAWHSRASLIRPEQKKQLQGKVLTLDDGFAADFFHAAPTNQRVAGFFAGDETIFLEGFSGSGPRIEWRLPAARAEAVRLNASGAPTPIGLHADLLRIDLERRVVTLTWRGYLPVDDDDALVVAAGVALPGQTIAWPEVVPADEEPQRSSPGPASGAPSLGETGVLLMDGLAAPTLPFAADQKSEPLDEKPASAPGAPWLGAQAQPPSAAKARADQKRTVHAGELRIDASGALIVDPSSPAVAPAPTPRPAPPPAVIAQAPVASGAPHLPAPAVAPARRGAAPGETVTLVPGLGSELVLALADRLRAKGQEP